MDNSEKEIFIYSYSSKNQEEIKAIRKKYSADGESEDKMAKLRRLDFAVTKKATAVALVLGVVGALVLGMGMSLVMTDIGLGLGFSGNAALFLGIGTGVTGIFSVCTAYPVYCRIINKERKKIAPEIIRLTDELMK